MALQGLQLSAQKFHPLKIGDKVPDVVLSVYHYKTSTAHLSEFNNRALILDFWATTCAPCVGAFPKLDSLQKEFRDQLTILPVTDESRATAASFFKRFSLVAHITPVSVVGDSILKQLFPFRTVPQHVWIDKNGIVKAITYPEAMTDENLRAFVKGEKLNLPVKEDDMVSQTSFPVGNLSDLLINEGAFNLGDEIQGDSTIFSFHLWAPCIPRYAGGYRDKGNMLALSNASLRAIFAIAYGESIFKFTRGTDNMVITNDSARFFDFDIGAGKTDQEYRDRWRKEPGHEYNYVLKVPKVDAAKKWEIMRADLAQTFPFLSASVEHRNREILILQKTGNNNNYQSKDTGVVNLQVNPYYLICNKLPMQAFSIALMKAYQDKKVVDETGYTGKVDIHIECKLHDLTSLNKELAIYGLSLNPRMENVEVVVIHDLRGLSTGSKYSGLQ
jgi:thiol-disulfide isomerase/thioredoxin